MIKEPGFTGIMHLLLLGLLPILVMVQASDPNPPSMTTTASTGTDSIQSTTLGDTTVTTTFNSLPSTATSRGSESTTNTLQPPTTITSGSTSTMNTLATSKGGETTTTTQSPSSITSGVVTGQSNAMTADSFTTTVHIHSSDSLNGYNSTNMTYCPSFTCNYSDCYTMYMYKNHNVTSCDPGDHCQLMKEMDMYTVGCSMYCNESCSKPSMTDCSVKCCNFTGCLNDSFASMMATTTVTATTTTTTATTTTTRVTATTTTPKTTVNNGNKCFTGTCTDTTSCYAAFKNAQLQICTTAEKHCQLKKETVNSKEQWTAGCTANCSAQTPCKASTQPPCHLECCNATMTSCLWLNGTLNFPSSSTRGLYLHTELIACLLCLFAITLML